MCLLVNRPCRPRRFLGASRRWGASPPHTPRSPRGWGPAWLGAGWWGSGWGWASPRRSRWGCGWVRYHLRNAPGYPKPPLGQIPCPAAVRSDATGGRPPGPAPLRGIPQLHGLGESGHGEAQPSDFRQADFPCAAVFPPTPPVFPSPTSAVCPRAGPRHAASPPNRLVGSCLAAPSFPGVPWGVGSGVLPLSVRKLRGVGVGGALPCGGDTYLSGGGRGPGRW